MNRKILCFILCCILIFANIPASFAEENNNADQYVKNPIKLSLEQIDEKYGGYMVNGIPFVTGDGALRDDIAKNPSKMESLAKDTKIEDLQKQRYFNAFSQYESEYYSDQKPDHKKEELVYVKWPNKEGKMVTVLAHLYTLMNLGIASFDTTNLKEWNYGGSGSKITATKNYVTEGRNLGVYAGNFPKGISIYNIQNNKEYNLYGTEYYSENQPTREFFWDGSTFNNPKSYYLYNQGKGLDNSTDQWDRLKDAAYSVPAYMYVYEPDFKPSYTPNIKPSKNGAVAKGLRWAKNMTKNGEEISDTKIDLWDQTNFPVKAMKDSNKKAFPTWLVNQKEATASVTTSFSINFSYIYTFSAPDKLEAISESIKAGRGDTAVPLCSLEKLVKEDGTALFHNNPKMTTAEVMEAFDAAYMRICSEDSSIASGEVSVMKQIRWRDFFCRFTGYSKYPTNPYDATWDFSRKSKTIVVAKYLPIYIMFVDASEIEKSIIEYEKGGYKWEDGKGWVREDNLSLDITSVSPNPVTLKTNEPETKTVNVEYTVNYAAVSGTGEKGPIDTEIKATLSGGNIAGNKEFITPTTINPGENKGTIEIPDVAFTGEKGEIEIRLEVNPNKDKPTKEATFDDNKDTEKTSVELGFDPNELNLKLDIDSLSPASTVIFGSNATTRTYVVSYHVDANYPNEITTKLTANLSGNMVSNRSESVDVTLTPGKNLLTYAFKNVSVSAKSGDFTVTLEVNPDKDKPKDETRYDDNKDSIKGSVGIAGDANPDPAHLPPGAKPENPNAKNPCDAYNDTHSVSPVWKKQYTVTTYYATEKGCGHDSSDKTSTNNESIKITKVNFKSKETGNNNVNMIADLANNGKKAKVKAGYGFELTFDFEHTMTETNRPDYYIRNVSCKNGRRTVSENDSIANHLNQIYVVDNSGQTLTDQTGGKYKKLFTCTYTRTPSKNGSTNSFTEKVHCEVLKRNVNGIKDTQKLYVSENEPNGKKKLTICSKPIQGVRDPFTILFDKITVYYWVEGAHTDDVDLSIIQ